METSCKQYGRDLRSQCASVTDSTVSCSDLGRRSALISIYEAKCKERNQRLERDARKIKEFAGDRLFRVHKDDREFVVAQGGSEGATSVKNAAEVN